MTKINSQTDNINTYGVAAIKVIGLGGAGGNAINYMIDSNECQNVEFIAANTDAQALEISKAPKRIQLGTKITKGLGAGSNPDVGKRAAEEDLDEVRQAITGADMLFLTAGLGGGTGTGAASIIAKLAKEMGILTVAVVTKPFVFEGKRRAAFAQEALTYLETCTDTMLVVPNQKLLEISDAKTSMIEAFGLSNNVLKQAVKGISDIIQQTGLVNVDFADVRATMKDMGLAIMGTGQATGENRAKKAAQQAINSPLLEDIRIEGARGILLNITGNKDMGLFEINEAAEEIYNLVSTDANIILGSVIDENMEDQIRVTVIATGLSYADALGVSGAKLDKNESSSRVHYVFDSQKQKEN